MDALAKLFPIFSLPDVWQTLIPIVVAAVVFFYFVYLLRKEENVEQAGEENTAEELGVEMRRHA